MYNPPPYDRDTTKAPPQQDYPQNAYPPQQPYAPQQGYQPQPGYPPNQPYSPQQTYPPYQQPQGQYYPPPQNPQQYPPGGVVVVTHGNVARSYQSFCGHIVFACFVFWCCGCLCGLIAFILAMIASDRASSGHDNEARQLGRASLGVSIAGVVVFVIIVGITIGLHLTASHHVYRKDWTRN